MSLLEKCYLWFYPKAYGWLKRFHVPGLSYTDRIEHNIVLTYIEKNFKDVIKKYPPLPPAICSSIDSKSSIYVMWYQGEEKMPPMVKACYNNIKVHACQHPVVLVTKHNVRQYTGNSPIWDDAIYQYLENGKISITHFSDLFRLCALYSYGGIWLDATIFLNRDIDEIISGLSFFSGRRDDVFDSHNVAAGKWTTYFICSFKGNPLMRFIFEILLAQLKKEGKFIQYCMQDYAFIFAFHHFQFVRDMIDAIPPMKNRFADLANKLNLPFTSEDDFCRMRSTSPFFKLTYKEDFKKVTVDGRKTYYLYVTEELRS